jgi:hypothetical protein
MEGMRDDVLLCPRAALRWRMVLRDFIGSARLVVLTVGNRAGQRDDATE